VSNKRVRAEVLLPPQVLADACLDLGGQGDELRVEVKRGKGVCFSGMHPDLRLGDNSHV
jgi:hypothetical protein